MAQRKRSKQINFRLSAEEHAALDEASKLYGVPISKLIRTALKAQLESMGHQPPDDIPAPSCGDCGTCDDCWSFGR